MFDEVQSWVDKGSSTALSSGSVFHSYTLEFRVVRYALGIGTCPSKGLGLQNRESQV